MSSDLRFSESETSLLTDLYELTMAASYLEEGFNEPASFSLTVRRLPPDRGYLVAAGLSRLVQAVQAFRFSTEALEYLESLKLFREPFLDYLAAFRFTGNIRAMREGTIFFGEEPILEVDGPLIEAQLLETIALNQIGVASLIASKAARSLAAAGGRRLIDFGLRRCQGADAGLVAARSSYLAGFDGTSNVLAGKRYGIPVHGTMAHSYVMAHELERDAFTGFLKSFPKRTTLLVDTYDTVRGTELAAQAALAMRKAGAALGGVRLDSGDLLELSRSAREILDRNGLADAGIFASGNLDEYRIAELVDAGAPIEAFGVGTAMVVSADAPSLDITYKLTEYAGKPRCKTSRGKITLPGRKQVFRAWDAAGGFYSDRIGLAEENSTEIGPQFEPRAARITELLETVMLHGRPVKPLPTLADSRREFIAHFGKLDPALKRLRDPAAYDVRRSSALEALLASEMRRVPERQR